MKHIIRLFILIAALVLGTDHALADVVLRVSNHRVKFVYVDENGSALSNVPGSAFAGDADDDGKVTITVTINEGQDYRCIEGDLTAEQSINSGNAEAPRRAPGKGVPVPLHYSKTNEFTFTLPEDQKTNVTVYVKFSSKLEFTPEVSIMGWTYGDAAKTPTITGNTSGGAVTYTYSDAEDGTYSTTVPTLAGPHYVKATVAATADYKACESAPKAFTISQKSITIASVNVEDKVYDGTTSATLSGTFSFHDGMIVEGDDVSINASGASAVFDDKDVGSGKSVTVTGLALSGTDMNNYVLTNSTFTTTANITKKDLIITAKYHSILYGNAAANNGVTYSGFVNGEDESVLEGTLTYTYKNDKGDYGEGNDAPSYYQNTPYQITPKGLTSNNYEITFVPGVLDVAPVHVSVRVVDKADGEKIETASVTVQVLDNGNQVTVCEFGFDTDINDLKAGKTYTLRETKAPEGYVLPSDLTFTIDNEGKITSSGSTTTDEFGTVLLLENSKTHVEVSVVDVADGKELVGATVQVIDGDGNVVKDLEGNDVVWTSDGSTHTIEGLKTGVTYTLRETVAPEGYTIPADYTFTIDETGKITTTGTVTQEGVLLVENAKTHVEVSVVDKANGAALAEATVQIIENTGESTETVAEEWTSTTENHIIEGLKTGVTYTLRETNAPSGYTAPADYTFTIDETGMVTTSGSITENGVLLVENTPQVTVTITGHSNTGEIIYDGQEKTVTGYDVVISNSLYTEAYFTFSGTAEAKGTDARTYNMGLTTENFSNTNENFDVTFDVTDGFLTINPKAVTVKADDKSKEFGADDPELTATVTGVIEGEDANTLINYTISREEGDVAGEYVITPTGETIQGNYTVTYETGTFTIFEIKDIATFPETDIIVPNQTLEGPNNPFDNIRYKFEYVNTSDGRSYVTQMGVVVKDGDKTLTLGTDYTFGSVKMANGDPIPDKSEIDDVCEVEIIGIGYYSGTVTREFNIVAPDANGSWGDNMNWAFHEGTLTITGTGAMNATTQGSYPWFSSANYIKTITIGEGVSTVAAEAFSGTSNVHSYGNLASVNLPSTLTTIGNNAFAYCSALPSVEIPASVTSIGTTAFNQCGNLNSVTLKGNPTIGEDAFNQIKDGAKVTMNLAATEVDGAKWTTFYNNYGNFQADTNTEVYKGAVSESKLVLTPISDKIVTKEQAVILKSTGTPIVMTLTATGITGDYSDNDLHGVSVRTLASEVKTTYGASTLTLYVMGNTSKGFGSHKYTGAYMPANKAFLALSSGSSAPLRMVFDDDTSIEAISQDAAEQEGIYDLQGRKVNQPSRGLYIVNGKKVMIK